MVTMAITKKMKTTIDPAAAAPSTAAVTLPEELIWEVLLRLPAKSLARFRCVCRSWNHLLRSDSAAAFQRLYSDRQQAAVGRGRLAFAAARLAPPHNCEVGEGLTLVMPCDGCPRFVGGGKPCHRGVALLSRPCTGAYTLCNVSTGGLLRLPPCPTVGGSCLISAAGVGYLAATDEYKVVQLALPTTDRPFPFWETLDCQVLTVGAAASDGGVRGGWRSAAIGSKTKILIDPMDPVFANGCLHWTLVTSMLLLRDDDGKPRPPEGILSFSLATETFATVPVPPFVTSDLVPYDDDHPHASHHPRTARTSDHRLVMQPFGTALAELDGCLCMIRDLRHRCDMAAMFEVWKLKDYESGVWSLDYRIHEDLLASSSSSSSLTTKKLMEPWLVIPICYLPSDDGDDDDDDGDGGGDRTTKKKILLATTAHEVHLYDPKTATLETIASAAHCCNYPDDPTKEDNELYLVMRQESLLHIHGMEYGAKGDH